jgi:hypothetical protein
MECPPRSRQTAEPQRHHDVGFHHKPHKGLPTQQRGSRNGAKAQRETATAFFTTKDTKELNSKTLAQFFVSFVVKP